ncbi:MAG: MBL fold metallo-hydrolase [Ignavibacteria bacterium]|nr:MBL fold metallo-hydrolase [Ignavibacteria bacterium]
MKIGEYKLYSVQTGLFKLDGGAMFGVVPKPLWSKTNPSDDRNRIDMCMRALLLISDKKKILIDNGAGNKLNDKLKDIYAIDHNEFTLEKELGRYGLTADEITDVIITHLHFDHAGGSTKLNENGEAVPAFPNAVYHIQEKHWQWALNPTERDKASFFPENYLPVEKNHQLKKYSGDTEFDEFISFYVLNGHSPGMQIVKISDKENTLLYAADLFPTSSHIPLPYIMAYDLFPLTTLEEKKKFLPKITEENWILFFEHDPFTETCHVIKTDKGFSIVEKSKLEELT